MADPNERNAVLIQYLASHVRSHLNVTMAGLNLLAADNQDPMLAQLILDTRGPCEKAVKQLSDMLLMEQIHSGTLSVDVRPSLVRPMVAACIDTFRSECAATEVELCVEFSDVGEECSVAADEPRIAMVLANMIAHALVFAKKGILSSRRVYPYHALMSMQATRSS